MALSKTRINFHDKIGEYGFQTVLKLSGSILIQKIINLKPCDF